MKASITKLSSHPPHTDPHKSMAQGLGFKLYVRDCYKEFVGLRRLQIVEALLRPFWELEARSRQGPPATRM